MSSISHEPARIPQGRSRWIDRLDLPEMWASLAIGAMWLAVAVGAIWGPDFVSTSSGGNSTTIPSAIFVALFAWLGSRAVAKYAFGRHV